MLQRANVRQLGFQGQLCFEHLELKRLNARLPLEVDLSLPG